MKHLNQVQLIWTIVKDIEVKTVGAWNTVANFSIVCNEEYKDKEWNKQTKAEFINICIWGGMTKVVEQCKKGDKIYIGGKISTRVSEYNDVKKYITEVIPNNIILLSSKSDSKEKNTKSKFTNDDISIDEIPF